MKVITLKPKEERRMTCCYCATIYSLEEFDVTAKISKNPDGSLRFCHDYLGEWRCPGCERVYSTQLYHLPWSWHAAIMARSLGLEEEYQALREAEKMREARLNTPVPVYESRFDILLRWFKLKK